MDLGRSRRRLAVWCSIVATAALITYWQAFRLPLISDDYVVISLSRSYGEPGGWQTLANDALYRCRAIFMILTHWLDRWFAIWPIPYNAAGVALHIVNSLLVLAFGAWRKIGWHISVPAALFFAVWHGHQEAVIWYSALPDQMAFFFVATCLLAWLAWLRTGRPAWYAAVCVLFAAGLLSKESAVVAIPLMIVVALFDQVPLRRIAWATAPFAIVGVLYFVAGFVDRSHHLHYNDGTFRLGFHFIPVILRSTWRLLWIWGLLALAAAAIWRWRSFSLIAFASAWIGIAFLPYAFLTYMPFVPSRHTYIAGFGLALIAAAGFRALHERFRTKPAVIVVAAVAVLGVEWGYLWTRKYQQYVERAAPTEAILERLRGHTGDAVVSCFPYGLDAAVHAARLNFGNRVQIRPAKTIRTQGPCDMNTDVQLVLPLKTAVLP